MSETATNTDKTKKSGPQRQYEYHYKRAKQLEAVKRLLEKELRSTVKDLAGTRADANKYKGQYAKSAKIELKGISEPKYTLPEFGVKIEPLVASDLEL